MATLATAAFESRKFRPEGRVAPAKEAVADETGARASGRGAARKAAAREWERGAGFTDRAPRRPVALGLIVAAHVALGAVLAFQHMDAPPKAPPEAIVLRDIPAPRALPVPVAPDPAPIVMETPTITMVAPDIRIETAAPAAPVAVARPAPPVAVAPAAVAVAAPPPAMVPDLATTMIEAPPPRYPLESRRLKEEGTVVLAVELAPNGRVAHLAVRKSSGSARLDKAALDAVRRWRWRPLVRDGVAVAAQGLVEIPFILRRA